MMGLADRFQIGFMLSLLARLGIAPRQQRAKAGELGFDGEPFGIAGLRRVDMPRSSRWRDI
jgi:hypothetical protein